MKEFDYLFPLRIPFKVFKLSGLWQDKNASTLYKVYGFVHVVFGMGIFTLCQMIYLVKAKSVLEASDCLSIFFTYIGCLIKATTVIVKLQDIFEALDHYESVAESIQAMDKKPLNYLKARLTQANNIFLVLWGSCFVTTIFGGIYPFVAFYLNPHPPFKTSYKMWAPFDFDESVPGFFAVAILELFNPILYSCVVATVVSLPVFFFNAASGLIEELTLKLSNIETETDNQDDATKQLIECIELHLKIKSFIKKVERIFSTMIFAEAACSLVIFCTTSFLLSKVSFYFLNYIRRPVSNEKTLNFLDFSVSWDVSLRSIGVVHVSNHSGFFDSVLFRQWSLSRFWEAFN